jgi:DNA-binding IclR family transcriptional regulator
VLSVDKALLIVELLMREEDSLTAREIAERIGINRTTAHRLVNALIQRGWIEKVVGSSSYRLSPRFLALARVSLQSHDFFAEIRPTLERLSRLSRETVHLGVMDGFEIVHVDKVDSPEAIGVSSKIGSRAVPHVTGLGKAILAASARRFVDEYLAYARKLPGPERVTDPRALLAELELTRVRGYSIDNEEASIGVRCLGVAVRGASGEPLVAISLTGPSPRFTPDRLEACVPEMVRTARELSVQFGWEEPLAAVPREGSVSEQVLAMRSR